MNNFLPQKRGMQVIWIIVGCLIYAVGLNVFIIPMNLYSGGAVGLAQLLSYGAGQIGIKEIAGLNLYGIIYLLLNIPILFIAWFKIGKTFFINTILGTVGISLFTSIVPTPATAVIADPVIGIIIGGVVTGAGIGIMLTAKGSGGGIEVIGIWMAKKYAGMSVGKLGTIFNLILYAIYLLVFDISTDDLFGRLPVLLHGNSGQDAFSEHQCENADFHEEEGNRRGNHERNRTWCYAVEW